MTSRKRNNTSPLSSLARRKRRQKNKSVSKSRRRSLLETLEARNLLAGPQLIGIQPNEGDLIENGTVRDTAPRVLTFGFDESQVIATNPATGEIEGIQITRSGSDGLFDTADDVVIEPGLTTLNDPNQNEVSVRFAESLPDDNYRIEVFGFDDPGLGVLGLRNVEGDLFQPSDPDARSEVIEFELRLGALIESIVPQPVVRQADGSLVQNRDEVVVFFNDDELFVENDADGNPTERSAENPRFYQLLLTEETVRTSDDSFFNPERVVYDAETNTARLFFGGDINELAELNGAAPRLGGATWRLRIGTGVEAIPGSTGVPLELNVTPTNGNIGANVATDFQQDGLRVEFQSRFAGEQFAGPSIQFVNSGLGGPAASLNGSAVVIDFGGSSPTVQEIADAVRADPGANSAIAISFERDGNSEGATGAGGVPLDGSDLIVPNSVVGAPPLQLTTVGDTLSTALDVGIFGQSDDLTSLIFTEAIDDRPATIPSFEIELLGGDDDIGHTTELAHINSLFGPDQTSSGITDIPYNFNPIFATNGGVGSLNQISLIQQTRIREALNLWAAEIGVQFRETADQGITFAVGDTADVPFATPQPALDASVNVDPTFATSTLVFSNQTQFNLNYGEDFTRKSVAGIGLLLGLNPTPDIPAPNILSFDNAFLNQSIDILNDLEPVFPNNTDILHGQFVHRPDSIDVDLFRFEVDLNDADRVGTFTAETFAERLPDSSSLDTSLTLFQEVSASANTSFGVGVDLDVEIQSLNPGLLGNNARVDFIRTDRAAGDTEVRVLRAFDNTGTEIENAVIVDVPRLGPNVSSVQVGSIVNAINSNAFSSSIFRASIGTGSAAIELDNSELPSVLLSGGGLTQISRNDDYFSEDSRIITSLGEGVYYIGVAASGNEFYDPTIASSGFGGRTQGEYQIHLRFEPQVDEVDVIRDLDSDRVDVPGTALDGDGDGVPGGVNNFFFQTVPLNRVVEFTDDGNAITPGQTVTIVGANNVVRTFEFVPVGSSPSPGNIPVTFNPGTAGFPTPSGVLATSLTGEINSRSGETGVTVARNGSVLTFTGERSTSFSDDFRGVTVFGRNIFVDKAAGPLSSGSLDSPFNNIANSAVANAFDSTLPGDIVRIVGNGGLDGDITTEVDNFSYQVGVSDTGGVTLEDGRNLEVPQGVTTIIDAGAIVKLRNAFIGIGSSTVQVDRSGGALQVLGTPRLVQLNPDDSTTLLGDEDADGDGFDDGSVIFTSTRDRAADAAAAGISPEAAPGNWGGLVYRRDIDAQQGRRDLEDEGIFLNRVNHAEIRFGGGSNVLIDSVQQLVNPIQIVGLRPTITFNEITQSADAAISAAPSSFEETSYQAPRFQQAGAFTADYDRVGAEIHNNELVDNSINGLFIRAATTATQTAQEFITASRFDDVDIVHFVAENLVVAAQPGGSIQDGIAPSLDLVVGQEIPGGELPGGVYEYVLTFVDRDGFESLPSPVPFSLSGTASSSSVELNGLPAASLDDGYVSRRLYRATLSESPEFFLVADLDGDSSSFIDNGTAGAAALDLSREGIRGRLDASLVFDPGLVVKLTGARIELGQGTQLLAEGSASDPVVFTSVFDDRFGAGGTFDTNNDSATGFSSEPERGDWSGVYAGPTSNVSFDNVQLSYAGGISLIEGGNSRGFLPLELQQAEGRITNSTFEFNDSGQDGAGPAGRFGRLAVTPATIFVRGSQPIIVGNTFIDNRGTIIDIDVESLGGNLRQDIGRQSGDIDRISVTDDNYGPLIRFNRYLNDVTSGSQLSGLEIRGGTITTETVFDDTDIAHLVFDTIEVGDLHSSGSLRLQSRPDESLVVKFTGSGNPNDENSGTGLTANGSVSGIADRVGGTIHVIGLPGAPVILTSINDDTVGAGFAPDGSQFTDHDGDGVNSRPFENDWRGILLDEFSNDYNVAFLPELELSTEVAPGLNATTENAQFLGELASDILTGDDTRRLGFEVQGFLSGTNDVDVYSFLGTPGTDVFVDIDSTAFSLDTVIELLDENGNVLARSDNSSVETLPGAAPIDVFDSTLEGAGSLLASPELFADRGEGGLLEDHDSTNPRDAGIRFRLAGNDSDPNARSVFFFRVRSASINPDDAQGGLTGGSYQFQARITEEQAFPGSVVRFADIRYSNIGIHVRGLTSSSPLLGEAQENEAAAGFAASNDAPTIFDGSQTFAQGAQYVGNLTNNASNVISIGGELASNADVDFYTFEVDRFQSVVFDIDYADGFNRPDTNLSIFQDFDGPGPAQPVLIYFGSNSNIADDQTSPLGENTALELLSRGSVSNGDPFVGAVNLTPGTYYVAVSADGLEPSTFQGSVVEPVNSTLRIVEDRIDAFAPSSTADPALVTDLFTDAAIASSAFSITTDNALGHGALLNVDGTTPQPLPAVPSPVFNGDLLAFGSLNTLPFSLSDDPNIGGDNGELTASTIPHVSITGDFSTGAVETFQLDVADDAFNPGPQRVILDIDNGFDGLFDNDGLVDTPDIVLPTSVHTLLTVTDIAGNVVATSNFGDLTDGGQGSVSTTDAFIDTFLLPGTYFISVQQDLATATLLGELAGADADYTLHVSVASNVAEVANPGSFIGSSQPDVLSFDRSVSSGSGTITSESFDLAGYEAADVPLLYLNNRFRPLPGDTATLTITSDNPANVLTHQFVASSGAFQPFADALGWDQLRLPLDIFAGDTGIRLTVEYNSGSAATLPQAGLHLDDFIVGFGERGEIVFEAAAGADFVGFGTGAAGAYQLEVRLATDFATNDGFSTTLQQTFDTNDRQNRSVTLIAPDFSQVSDGDTFVLGDGGANLTFEFDDNNIVTFGNSRIEIEPTDTPVEIAESIRTAINNQTLIQIEAASSGGNDTGALTDARVALHGNAVGSLVDVGSVLNAPTGALTTDANGNLELAAILHNGIGDSNFVRPQSVVIVENNIISDARAIGIWYEPGTRGINPNHISQPVVANNPLLTAPLVGNSTPGAVQNLPVLNDSVLGGLTPGIVIQNNIIDQAGRAGIQIDGELAPISILPPTSGDLIQDGSTFAIDADGTRVVFEFEDIGDGNPTGPLFGSGVNGGDGVRDGHVPVYYRQTDSDAGFYLGRGTAYTQLEISHAIRDAIQGSILQTNGLVELVEVSVGPRLNGSSPGNGDGLLFSESAVYVTGATQIRWDPSTNLLGELLPVYEAPQPFARIINNTIFGEDGTAAQFPESSNENQNPNDFLSDAVDTRLGQSHVSIYTSTDQATGRQAILGDSTSPLAPSADVDFYQVELEVGDRILVDIDTLAGGPDTFLTVFDSNGIVAIDLASGNLATNSSGVAPANFATPGAANVDVDDANGRDAYIDFTASVTGTFFIGVSEEGNNDFDTQSLSGRTAGTGTTGAYDLTVRTLAPRSFVLSIQNGSGSNGANEADRGGTTGFAGTIVVTQIPDANGQVFEQTFTLNGGSVSDIMRNLSNAINASPLLNNGGPIPDVSAAALGGSQGNNSGLESFAPFLFTPDFNTGGFGHNRATTPGAGSTELYTLIENVADVRIIDSNGGALRLDPIAGRDTDQLLNETGILITGGASPTILNNVLLNLHESIVAEETQALGFGRGADQQPRPMDVIVAGNVFQHQSGLITNANQTVFFGNTNTGITTSPGSPSNVNGGNDDFNVILANQDIALQNPAGNNFQPEPGSGIIDSALSSLDERSPLLNLRTSVGLPISNVLSPTIDVAGILRADNPDFVSPFPGTGASVFNDRGASELADFIGPVAIAEFPRDNDANGLDSDPSISVINLTSGVFEEFRIQLRDTGDASDPFAGIGIDDSTVVVPEIPGVRPSGANVTVFENEQLLIEGVDYTFSYDETRNIITLTPLAGIWRDDRAYRIAFNNIDRSVLVAQDASNLEDGTQFVITDSNNGDVVFEIETGFQLSLPETITLIVPQEGITQGGLTDGDIFQIDDGVNPPVVFEYDSDGVQLPGTIPVLLPSIMPAAPALLSGFLNEIAVNTQQAIEGQIAAGNLDLDTCLLSSDGECFSAAESHLSGDADRVVLGAERGATVRTTGSGLIQPINTLGLEVPDIGVDPLTGIQPGDSFVIDENSQQTRFEFNDGGLAQPGSVLIDISVDPLTGLPPSALQIAEATVAAIVDSPVELSPSVVGNTVFLNLTDGITVIPAPGQLSLVGVSRTPLDGDTIEFSPSDGSANVVLEINRTDEAINDGVTAPNIPINTTRLTRASELASLTAAAIQSQSIAGLNTGLVQAAGNLLAIGGEEGLGLAVTGSTIEIIGSPDVTEASTLSIFGALQLTLPIIGGSSIVDGSVLTIQDDAGNDVLFEFDLNGVQVFNGATGPISNIVTYLPTDDAPTLAASLVAAINAAAVPGVGATNLGGGTIALGTIAESRVDTSGIPQVSVQRGIVTDGEFFSIRQGNNTVTFEFEEATSGGGLSDPSRVAVAFQAGSSTADVAIGLAAAINNNRGPLLINAVAVLDLNGDPTGEVSLNDIPGTVVDVSGSATLNLTGVPGGSVPVRISPVSTAAEVRSALVTAINGINQPGQVAATTLSAADRGGASLFVENALVFDGPLTSFFLPAITDLSGNPLEANREDFTTQFTILLPTVGLDFGDAPDPVLSVPGRFPTTFESDGARHVVDDQLFLGSLIDIDADGQPVAAADGDDSVTDISTTGPLFTVSIVDGAAQIEFDPTVDPSTRDGDTITIDTGVDVATLELDLDGLFNEDNFAIRPTDNSTLSIAQAIEEAIAESPLRPATVELDGDSVRVISDDEDGVSFVSAVNPGGILNRFVDTPIDVTVTGSGILQAWIDFNADGDWDDPGEQFITGAVFSDTGGPVTQTFVISVPETAPEPPTTLTTYARFRVSREGGLSPSGLALSGEVEDYALLLVPGGPPVLSQSLRTFTVDENQQLQALDASGVLTPGTDNDNGLLAGVLDNNGSLTQGIVDPDGDAVAIFAEDVGQRTLFTSTGVLAGELNVASDGTFTFEPDDVSNFNGQVSFTVRVTDVLPFTPASQAVASEPLTVTIDVLPVNDPPLATVSPISVQAATSEDVGLTFTADQLITPFFIAGPANELGDQTLAFQSVSSVRGQFVTSEGGVVSISADGLSINYTPPEDFNGLPNDTFTYSIVDVPGANEVGQTPEIAAVQGVVTISISPVNDAPIALDDVFSIDGAQSTFIPLNGFTDANGIFSTGIFDNDAPGPQNESDQTFGFTPAQFPITSTRGSTLSLGVSPDDGVTQGVIFTPAAFLSGTEAFTYSVVDSDPTNPLIGQANVIFIVGDTENPPFFSGVNGVAGVTSLVLDESNVVPQTPEFDLSIWFEDPENDALTFSVVAANSALVGASVEDNILTLNLPSFAFGETTITVTATDSTGLSTSQIIDITVNNTPNPPSVTGIGFGDRQSNEDENVIINLTTVFEDPDLEQLSYQVVRLGTTINPTATQIAQNQLIQSITFVGDQLIIVPQPDRPILEPESVEIEVSASDGSFVVSDSFTLTINPVQDAPISLGDSYNVPIGTELQVLNPSDGLLRNDVDADGDAIRAELVSGPAFGILNLNDDGTFTYLNTGGSLGDVDSFTYRAVEIGNPNSASAPVVVSLTLNQSAFQNPIADLISDVNADGNVSAIDALLIINLLDRSLEPNASTLSVSAIGTPPPDFVDVNGDGAVSAIDALIVINQLDQRTTAANGEQIVSNFVPAANGEQVVSDFVSASTPAVADTLLSNDSVPTSREDALDSILAMGMEIDSNVPERAVQSLAFTSDTDAETSPQNADSALTSLLEDDLMQSFQ